MASSAASPHCPARLVVPLSPAAPVAAPSEASFVRPEPTPRVRYASRVPLQYEDADEEDQELEEWMRLYGLAGPGGTVSAATGRRLSPIRAFGQHHRHRRTASLDNIVDGIAPAGPTPSKSTEVRQLKNRLRPELPALAGESVSHGRSSRWSPQRFVGKLDSTPVSKENNKTISALKSPEEPNSGLKTRLKSISEKYLKNPVAGIMMNGRDTITSGLLNKIKNGHKAKNGDRHRCEQDGSSRSSFRSFSCSTLPALDEFQRKKMLAAVAAAELHDDIDSPGSPAAPRGEGDSDSGIVPEWSDTSSISESSYIRHYQPCQLLSSWRKPQPKVRRSLSPIFQYRTMDGGAQVDEVDSSINTSSSSTSSAAYEAIWPTQEDEPQVKEHLSILSGEESSLHVEEGDEFPLPPAEGPRVHTTRIRIEYSPPGDVQGAPAASPPPSQRRAPAPSRPHYQTASLDRRALKETKLAVSDREGGASVHLIKIERDPDNLKAELGIFIAKKKLARGSIGYLVAHIVPGGLVDRYLN